MQEWSPTWCLFISFTFKPCTDSFQSWWPECLRSNLCASYWATLPDYSRSHTTLKGVTAKAEAWCWSKGRTESRKPRSQPRLSKTRCTLPRHGNKLVRSIFGLPWSGKCLAGRRVLRLLIKVLSRMTKVMTVLLLAEDILGYLEELLPSVELWKPNCRMGIWSSLPLINQGAVYCIQANARTTIRTFSTLRILS